MKACEIKNKIGLDWQGTTPGFVMAVLQGGELQANLRFGITYPIYDWASLTKMVFTLTLYMKCVEENLSSEDDLVGFYLPELRDNKTLRIRHLLSHSAGLPGTIDFWHNRPADPAAIPGEWRRQVLSLPMGPVDRSVYTEIDFQILGYVLEKILGPDIESHWKKLAAQINLKNTFFRPLDLEQTGCERIAPTELCHLREKRIQGEVHHPDIWLNGGVGWLSGLFGPMEDFVTWAEGLRRAYYGIGAPWVVSPQTLKRFVTRISHPGGGSSSLGFMMPKIGRRDGQKYYLSAGSKFHSTSIGHTGFTGPMFWFDPQRDLFVLVLANRTFPNATNETWFNFRGVIHDRIVETFEEEQLKENVI